MGISVRWSRVQILPSYSWLDLLFGWLVKSQVQLLGHTSVNSLLVCPRPVEILNCVSLSLKNHLRVADKYKYFLYLFSFDPGKVSLMRLWRVGGGGSKPSPSSPLQQMLKIFSQLSSHWFLIQNVTNKKNVSSHKGGCLAHLAKTN